MSATCLHWLLTSSSLSFAVFAIIYHYRNHPTLASLCYWDKVTGSDRKRSSACARVFSTNIALKSSPDSYGPPFFNFFFLFTWYCLSGLVTSLFVISCSSFKQRVRFASTTVSGPGNVIISLICVMVCINISILAYPATQVTFILFIFSFIGRIRPASPYVGSLQPARGAYVGGFGYQQPVSYSYQQGLVYPPYGWVRCCCSLSQNEHLLWRFVFIAEKYCYLACSLYLLYLRVPLPYF